MQGITQGAEDVEAPLGCGGLGRSRSAICRGAPRGARGPGAGGGLPSLDANFRRIWEKQRDSTWHRIPLWEALYRHVVEGPKQLRLYVTSWMNGARNQAITCENYCFCLLAEKPKVGFKAGGVGGNGSCQFETDIFVFSFFSEMKTTKLSFWVNLKCLIRSKRKRSVLIWGYLTPAFPLSS